MKRLSYSIKQMTQLLTKKCRVSNNQSHICPKLKGGQKDKNDTQTQKEKETFKECFVWEVCEE